MSLNVTAAPSPPLPATSLAPDRNHTVLEDIGITLAVFSLIIINIALFLFWRYKALGKSPLPFRRYTGDSEAYSSLQQPVMTKGTIPTHPQRRVQEVLKQYASTVVRVGQNHISRKSSSSLYASFSEDNSDASPIQTDHSLDRKNKTTASPAKKSEERCSILAYEQSPARRSESGVYDDNSVRFKLGHPEEDSTTTGGESDSQVYCEVIDVASKRHGRHIRPISFDIYKDKDDTPSHASQNNNDISIRAENHMTDDGGMENVYENFRRRKPTSNFASMTKSKGSPSRESIAAMYSSCRTVSTVSGDYATCDASGSWRPTSFAFCRDAPPSVTDTTLSRTSMVSEQYPHGDATYEQFVEPDDPIYAQTVIRRSKRSLKQYPSSLPRDAILSSQPLYEQPVFEQPLYENFEKSEQDEADINEHRYSSVHLEAPMNSHLTASDSRINVNSDSRRSRRGHGASDGVDSRRLTARVSNKPDQGGDVSPHATSPGVAIPEANMTSNQSSFHTIARELAGLHEDSVDDYDPEESFPVVQMLSDRYSTGNFLNKFY